MTKGDDLHAIGQFTTEADDAEHPWLSHPLQSIFELAASHKLDPTVVANWDADVFYLYRRYLQGRVRGLEIKAASNG